jgi:putative FmdB family regulatory protein
LPLYAYRCTQCGHSFEKIQSFSDQPEQVCPKCGGKLERPLTAPRFQFKGAGWYVNDYASKSSTPAEGSSTESKAPAAESGAKESKPTSSTESSSSAASSTPSSSSTGSGASSS